jgi:hypothetical protein
MALISRWILRCPRVEKKTSRDRDHRAALKRQRFAIAAERDFDFALPALDAYQRESGWHLVALRKNRKSKKLVGGDGRSRTYDTADMSRML